MYDKDAFLAKMSELGMTITTISNLSGISYKALYPKVHGDREWTLDQIERTSAAMRLSHADKVRIFMPR